MLKSNKARAVALALASMAVLSAADGADKAVQQSAKAAKQAAKALTKNDAAKAVAAAEQAVALAPTVAGYRMLLGQSYLQAGRFRSAGDAFADTLRLDNGNGRAALNLALTQIAGGDWQAARRTLADNSRSIPASDLGLAMALAGDTQGAVALLTQVARSPAATAKVRQNLALSYALAGQWGVARMVAAADMAPAQVDERIQQWAVFAQPQSAADQVASLLGVQPVADGGQPAALALIQPASAAPVAAPVAVAAAEPAPAAPEPAPVAVAAVAPAKPGVVFGPSREVVQALPAPVLDAGRMAFKTPIKAAPAKVAAVRVAKPATAGGGAWHVQLGAFDSAGVAKDAWGRATRRFAGFKGHMPQGASFRTASATFYRLSVGGFNRAEADKACRAYRARGGSCFVRIGAGDQVANWAKPGVQLAARKVTNARS